MASKPPAFDWARYAVERARAGDPRALIGRVMNALDGRVKLSREEILLVRDALEATEGRETAGKLRELEKRLIALQVDGLVDDDGDEPKKAVSKVMEDRGRSLRRLRTALSKYGKPRRR